MSTLLEPAPTWPHVPHPRPYQRDAADRVMGQWEAGVSSLVALPTGTGKTIVMAELARRFWWQKGKPALVLTHRGVLTQQAAAKMRECGGLEVGIEKAEQSCGLDGIFTPECVVGSVQTLQGERLQSFRPDCFSAVIVDEAHRYLAPTFREAIEYFEAPAVGFTATPDRGDKRPLSELFSVVAFDMDIVTAIEEGWLVDYDVYPVALPELDISGVSTVRGELHNQQLHDEVFSVLAAAATAVSFTVEGLAMADKPMLSFLPSVPCAEGFATALSDLGISTQALSGKDDQARRNAVLEEVETGVLQGLSNCDLLTEGFDWPGVQLLVDLAPTKTRSRHTQKYGRGFRPVCHLDPDASPEARRAAIAASEKPRLAILDMVGNDGEHRLSCATDILGEDDQEVADKAAEMVREKREGGESYSPTELLEEARGIVIREREKAMLAKVSSEPVVTVSTSLVSWIKSLPPGRLVPPTERQLGALENAGLRADELQAVETKFRASQILDHLAERREKGICTLKQGRILKKHGLPRTTKEQASTWIGGIFEAGGEVPPWVRRQAAAIQGPACRGCGGSGWSKASAGRCGECA